MEQAGLIVGTLGGVFGVLGVTASIALGVLTWRRTQRQDTVQEAGQGAVVAASLEYIKDGVKDIQREQRLIRDEIGAVAQRVSKVEGRLEEHIKNHQPDR